MVKKKRLEFGLKLKNLMIIIHGENTTNSRQKLVEVINDQKNKNQEIIRLEAKQLTEASLEEALGANDLFGTSKTIIIEELHSLPVSKKKKNLIDLISKPQIHNIVLWEKRSLTKTMLGKIANDSNKSSFTDFEFKISKTLFTWLDSLGKTGDNQKKLQLLHSAIETDGEFFCFLMLIRQIRMLIEIKSGGIAKGAPFMTAKLNQQASNFKLKQLLGFYKELLEIDIKQKTSASLIDTVAMLDLLSLKL
ncbi:MAG: hypothetical protein COZ34_00130 [Candidatus Pacebacteria bacterium CG_4_10_14_3_um_filter_34_15]|nr:MAG: hypothetical protein AUJ41_01995 [Candidatus Pacebacteria bacterium CG1_02_43_31]PIQ81270.1 MAG: hypothetical protein COV78_01195 [Candidatus Pacebacteria bacterium CG11_big_fil_rev_8_21_14_0_20_34_55]PIX82050.1 MAG: hypothetical protein COZ34_00130 [Candidatus Pacebacteria bacterium CG_4_10_14_3_um_filter_34_15]PJC43734.1 MAG: hypothetical protein CO039_02510 [Candidatus Pacebacteria bacterium CG_4_9_14_0_2_um_filter_34_50]